MSGAPVGAVVSICYDAADPIEVGDHLRTPAGRCYRVLEVKTVKRGDNAGRRHRLTCLVTSEVPQGSRVHPLYWYSRG